MKLFAKIRAFKGFTIPLHWKVSFVKYKTLKMWAHLSVHLCKLTVNFLTECIFLFSPKEKINFPTRCLKNFGEFESRNSIRSVFQLKKWVKVFKNGPRKIYRRQPLKNLKGYGLLRQAILLQISEGVSSSNFTWSILEYLDPNKDSLELD